MKHFTLLLVLANVHNYNLHIITYTETISPVYTRPAGSGFHLPSVAHAALILPAGTNPGSHLKIISAPSAVFWYVSMEPLPGVTGCSQLTGIVMYKKNSLSGKKERLRKKETQSCTVEE